MGARRIRVCAYRTGVCPYRNGVCADCEPIYTTFYLTFVNFFRRSHGPSLNPTSSQTLNLSSIPRKSIPFAPAELRKVLSIPLRLSKPVKVDGRKTKARKPLEDIVLDPTDSNKRRRQLNILIARKSRQDKEKKINTLEKEIQRLNSEVARWKGEAERLGYQICYCLLVVVGCSDYSSHGYGGHAGRTFDWP